MEWISWFDDRKHHNLFVKAQVYKSTIQQMRRVLRPGDSVIELGCGSGRTAMLMADMGYRTVAVDLSYQLLDRLSCVSGFYGDLTCVNADMSMLPFKTKSFALAYSCEVLEHFEREEVVSFLKEQKRIADFVVADVPNDRCKTQAFGDEIFYSDDEWKAMFEQAGLQVVNNFRRGLDNGNRIDNCSVFLAKDASSTIKIKEVVDVYDHY